METETNKVDVGVAHLFHYTTEPAVCRVHGAFTRHVTLFEGGRRLLGECPCCIQERERREQEQARRARYEAACERCNIGRRFYDATLENYVPENKSEEQALRRSRDLLAGVIENLVLLGGNGLGKTHLGSALAREKRGLVMSMIEIATVIKRSFKRTDTGDTWRGMDEADILERLSRVPLLVIDELGRSYSSQAEANWLSYIIDKRGVRLLPTVICSNLHLARDCPDAGCPACFENRLTPDVVSRLSGAETSIVTMRGRDRRREGGTRKPAC